MYIIEKEHIMAFYIIVFIVMFVDVGKNRPFLDQLPFIFVSESQLGLCSTHVRLHTSLPRN